MWKKSERRETKIINKKLIPKNPRLIHGLTFDMNCPRSNLSNMKYILYI
ncbi:MAG: hypothetical protein NPMRth3_720004, partial [Nitrosopumilales archaeon]